MSGGRHQIGPGDHRVARDKADTADAENLPPRAARVSGSGVTDLQMMDERGGDVGGVEALLQQSLDGVVLLFVFAAGCSVARSLSRNRFARTS